MRENRVLDLLLTPPDGSESLARWLYNALKSAILTRRLVGGQALPSTRSLSERYGVSRGTVISAFEELKAEGYLVSRQGSATRVSQVLPDSFF